MPGEQLPKPESTGGLKLELTKRRDYFRAQDSGFGLTAVLEVTLNPSSALPEHRLGLGFGVPL